MTDAPMIVKHYIASGRTVTTCCGRFPHQLPRTDRIAPTDAEANCTGDLGALVHQAVLEACAARGVGTAAEGLAWRTAAIFNRLAGTLPGRPGVWRVPPLPVEPPMSVTRVAALGSTPGGTRWWHVRPNQWYPASMHGDRAALSALGPLKCDTWRHVLHASGGIVIDDTGPGEPPLNREDR